MKKLLVIALVGLLVLAGCASGSNSNETGELVREYKAVYDTDIDSLDYADTMKRPNNQHFANFIDGLYESDPLGNLVPAVAESHTVSEDELTYTFKIRPGVKWVTNTGEEFAEVKADDWVATIEHAVAVDSETLAIVHDSIAGLAAYINDPSLGIESVGVKALDDSTLEITLTQPEPFFLSKTGYGILFPINRQFLESKGESFGSLAPDTILYNGPFILESSTAKSSISYTKNENYWDKDNIFIDRVQFTFTDGSNPGEYISQYENGSLTSARVYPNLPEYPAVKEKYGDDITTSLTDGSTYYMTFNVNRKSYNHTSKSDETQRTTTQKALLNRNFRLALGHAFNRGAYNAQNVGEDLKFGSLRNSLVPPDFVEIAGKTYGQVLKEELVKLDPEVWTDYKPEDSQDGLYNIDLAKTLFEKAKTELETEGVTFPIHLDVPVNSSTEVSVNRVKSLKATIEETLGSENVVIDIQLLEKDPYMAATFYADMGKESDFDISVASGWGPDYQDPLTYLNIFNTRNGDVIHILGLDAEQSKDPSAFAEAEPIMQAVGLDTFTQLLNEAKAIVDNDDARFAAFAKAEAALMNEMLYVPTTSGGGLPVITNVIPYTKSFSWVGLSQDKLKWMKIQTNPVSQTQFEEAKQEWETKRSETGTTQE